MISDREKLLSKIRKLFSLSQSSNPNEAMLAMEKARVLLAEHQISESEVFLDETEESAREQIHGIFTSMNLPGLALWVRMLVKGVEELYDCRILYYSNRKSLRVFGDEATATTAALTMEYLHKCASDLASSSMEKFRGAGLDRANYNKLRYSLLEGFGCGVRAQVRSVLQSSIVSKSRALMVVKRQNLNRVLESTLNIVPSSVPVAHGHNESLFSYGYRRGEQVSLNRQLSSSQNPKLEQDYDRPDEGN